MNFAYNIIFVSISSSCYVWLLPKGKHTTQVPQMSNILTCITALSTWNAAEVRKRRRHVTSEEVVRRKQFTNTAHNHSSNRSADLTSTATIPPTNQALATTLKVQIYARLSCNCRMPRKCGRLMRIRNKHDTTYRLGPRCNEQADMST